MRRWTLVTFASLTACTPDAATFATGMNGPGSSASAVTTARAVVRGDAGDVFYGGTRLRRVSFGAAGGRGAPAGGTLELAPWRAAREGDARGGIHDARFQVTCLEVAGTRAWMGVRVVGGVTGEEPGGDVWYVEDGGTGGVDRVGVWVGLAPEACRARPAMPWALPLEHGQLEVTAN